MRFFFAVALLGVLLSSAPTRAEQAANRDDLVIFRGACDASAAVILEAGTLLVAEDSNNILRRYSLEGGDPIGTFDAYSHSEVDPNINSNFSALEGAARLKDRVYWISSHARAQDGRNRPNRRRFFALQVVAGANGEDVAPVGVSQRRFANAVEAEQQFAPLRLAQSILIRHSTLPHLAPERSGFMITGLAAAKDGEGLLIGLRNPQRLGKAIVISLLNPALLTRGPAVPKFGEAILLDLGGHGISSMEYSPATSSYFIVAASYNPRRPHRLYEWSGDVAAAPVQLQEITPQGFTPEAMVVADGGKRVLLLSDDGSVTSAVAGPEECGRRMQTENQCVCTGLQDTARKSFRGKWVNIVRPQ